MTAPKPLLITRPAHRPTGERREHPRRASHRPVEVMPLEADLTPALDRWLPAECLDVSGGGCSLGIDRRERLRTFALVLKATSDERASYATLVIDSQAPTNQGQRVSGHWARRHDDDPLAPDRLRPRLNPQQLRYTHGLEDSVLQAWCQLGVLRQVLVDRVLMCGRCHALPSWRHGCHVCGSGRIATGRLMKHRTCGFRGRAHEFEQQSGWQCPACDQGDLRLPADLEAIDGPTNCFDCGAIGGQPVMAAMCHGCQRRFGIEDAVEQPLYGYQVRRLDPPQLSGERSITVP